MKEVNRSEQKRMGIDGSHQGKSIHIKRTVDRYYTFVTQLARVSIPIGI